MLANDMEMDVPCCYGDFNVHVAVAMDHVTINVHVAMGMDHVANVCVAMAIVYGTMELLLYMLLWQWTMLLWSACCHGILLCPCSYGNGPMLLLSC